SLYVVSISLSFLFSFYFLLFFFFFFFFNDTAPTEIYTLSLHDALPISYADSDRLARRQVLADKLLNLVVTDRLHLVEVARHDKVDRKSTRLNSSHLVISYAVFCLKKKKKKLKIIYNIEIIIHLCLYIL